MKNFVHGIMCITLCITGTVSWTACDDTGPLGSPLVYPSDPPPGIITSGDYGKSSVIELLTDESANIYVLFRTSENAGPQRSVVYKYDAAGVSLWSTGEMHYYPGPSSIDLQPDGRLLLWDQPDVRVISADGTVAEDWRLFDSTYWRLRTILPDGSIVGIKIEGERAVLAIGDILGEKRRLPLPGKADNDTWTGCAALSDHEVVLSGVQGILIADLAAESVRRIVAPERLRSYERNILRVGPNRSILCAGEPSYWKDEDTGQPTRVRCFDDQGSERWSLSLPAYELRGIFPLTADQILLATTRNGANNASMAIVQKLDASGSTVWEWCPQGSTLVPETGVRTVVSTDVYRFALRPDGSIIVGGSAVGWTTAEQCAWIARLLPEGRIDETFGSPSLTR